MFPLVIQLTSSFAAFLRGDVRTSKINMSSNFTASPSSPQNGVLRVPCQQSEIHVPSPRHLLLLPRTSFIRCLPALKTSLTQQFFPRELMISRVTSPRHLSHHFPPRHLVPPSWPRRPPSTLINAVPLQASSLFASLVLPRVVQDYPLAQHSGRGELILLLSPGSPLPLTSTFSAGEQGDRLPRSPSLPVIGLEAVG